MKTKSSIFDSSDQENLNRKIAVGLDRVAQVLKTLVWRESKTSGVSPIQIQFLTMLLYAADDMATIGFLASQFSLTPATVSDAITALEQKGLVARERRKADRRTVFVSLTRTGRSSARKFSKWANMLEEKVGELPETHKSIVLQSLMSIIKGFQEEGVVSAMQMCVTCKFFRQDAHANSALPHHCTHFDTPFGDADKRIDCPDFASAVSHSMI